MSAECNASSRMTVQNSNIFIFEMPNFSVKMSAYISKQQVKVWLKRTGILQVSSYSIAQKMKTNQLYIEPVNASGVI